MKSPKYKRTNKYNKHKDVTIDGYTIFVKVKILPLKYTFLKKDIYIDITVNTYHETETKTQSHPHVSGILKKSSTSTSDTMSRRSPTIRPYGPVTRGPHVRLRSRHYHHPGPIQSGVLGPVTYFRIPSKL